MDYGRRITVGQMEYGTGGLWHMIGRWITAVCNTGAGRRVTAGGSRQRYRWEADYGGDG